ncbi:MAG: hypothetical protein ACTHQQ_21365, partial [Solirubrobacteraceae bacterium]
RTSRNRLLTNPALPAAAGVPGRARVAARSSKSGSSPVTSPLVTEVGICGQIDGNPLVIQQDLATT